MSDEPGSGPFFWAILEKYGSYLNGHLNDISTIGAGPNFSGPIRILRRQYGRFRTYHICKNSFILQKNTFFSEFYWG
jgi:hypothetical protein